MTDRDVSEIGRILSSLEDYDESNDSLLRAGDTVVLDSEYLKEKNFANALLLRPSSSNVFLSVPDSEVFFGKKIQ